MSSPTSEKNAHPVLTPAMVWLMAIATGLTVASNYYAQPLLHAIASHFNMSISMAGFIVTSAQLGYAAGLLFIVPLGDLLERRRLIVVLSLLVAAGLLMTAFSPNALFVLIGTALTGLCTVTAMVLVPLAATLAAPHERGRVVGTVMSGLLMGILLARTVAGLLADLGSWRTVYFVASGLMVIMAYALWRVLPKFQQNAGLSYPRLLLSIVDIYMKEPILRLRAVMGALIFSVFSVLWTSMAFLLSSPPFNYSTTMIGLFGLAGAAGALGAAPMGRMADRGKAVQGTTMGLILLALSWIPIGFSTASVWLLLVGILALDLAVQGVHVINQSVNFRQRPEARSRITSGYMTSYFIGGAGGSLLSTYVYERAGWHGVSLVGFGLSALCLVIWLFGRNREVTTADYNQARH